MGSECKNCSKGPMKFCPFSAGLFLASTLAYYAIFLRQQQKQRSVDEKETELPTCQVVFVLGGPGTGKGTQCDRLNKRMGWAHLSAGDVLRAERKSGGPTADLINSKISNGEIVPAGITCGLLQKGMVAEFEKSGCKKFLIDGFPRSEGNVTAWNDTMSHHTVEFVLNFECPEEVLVGRLLERGKSSGREDDQIDVIRKRLETFRKECKPIVDMYAKKDMVRTVQADQSIDAVYEEVAALFKNL